MRASNGYVGFGLATLSGCLWFLACTPFDFSALGWIAAVPMLLAVDRAPSLKSALFLGWWAGVVETGGGFYWLIELTQRFAGFPWIAAAAVFLVFCASRALIFLIFSALVCWLRRRRVPMALLAPLAMTVGEFVVPQVFPCGQWISQAWATPIIQISELTGPLGVTALLMLCNGALYDVIDRDPAARWSAAAAVLVIAAALAFGAVRMRQIDRLVAQAPSLEVGLVQPNFAYAVDGDFSRDEALRELEALQDQSRRLERLGAELIIWSEGAYPITLPRDFAEDFPADSPARIRRGFNTPVVIGGDTFEEAADDAYNSALLLDARGKTVGRYDKVRLLAFGEYIPGIETFPWLRAMLPEGTGRFKAGSGPGIMELKQSSGTWRLGPVICYEDLLPGFIRGVGELHPDVLVNLTSDSWFGARTEPWEHLALAVFASVELRVAMVRSVNSGVSALIDPTGRLLAKTYANDPYRQPRGTDGIVVAVPKMAGGHTLFVAWGNWFPYACSLATLLLLGRWRRAAR